MPAVLDSIAGAGWVRGWLPLLNRFGNSIPPLLLARQVKISQKKKLVLLSSTGLMGVLFLLLASCFARDSIRQATWMPAAFLVIYTLALQKKSAMPPSKDSEGYATRVL
jgi:hypothetical protein